MLRTCRTVQLYPGRPFCRFSPRAGSRVVDIRTYVQWVFEINCRPVAGCNHRFRPHTSHARQAACASPAAGRRLAYTTLVRPALLHPPISHLNKPTGAPDSDPISQFQLILGRRIFHGIFRVSSENSALQGWVLNVGTLTTLSDPLNCTLGGFNPPLFWLEHARSTIHSLLRRSHSVFSRHCLS